MTDPCEREKYFNSQICEFRKMMGDKRFWEDHNKVALARNAISCLYIDGVDKEFANPVRVANTYLSTMQEFTHRAMMMRFEI